MNAAVVQPFPRLRSLPGTLPVEGAIRIELQAGIPVLRASHAVQDRVETLLHKQHECELTEEEAEELNRYEEIDDYLSFLNRVVRNLLQSPEAAQA
jgi:uncharacterized protein YnzC (UPF0291/DUF896 family)